MTESGRFRHTGSPFSWEVGLTEFRENFDPPCSFYLRYQANGRSLDFFGSVAWVRVTMHEMVRG